MVFVEKVYCNAIIPVISATGKRMFQVQFGVKVDSMKHQTQQGMPIIWDTVALVNVEEAVWDKMKGKFMVGQQYSLSVDEKGIGVK